jgi:putative transposase
MNRGVEKRDIVRTQGDVLRFISNLAELNTTTHAQQTRRQISTNTPKTFNQLKEGEMLVDIHGWCLMKNHYHLLLSERIEGGLSRFLQKINIGYTHYFNLKYERTGVLFQGKTKKVPVVDDGHLFYLLHYIHANPLDTHKETSGWREYALKNKNAAITFLDTYPWSSYHAYVHNKNDTITDVSFFAEVFKEGNTIYEKSFFSFLEGVTEHAPFSEKELE